MKGLILVVALALSVSTYAQKRGGGGHPGGLKEHILVQKDRMDSLINRKLHELNRLELSELSNLMRQVNSLLRGHGPGRPGNPGGPGRPPIDPFPQMSIMGTIENSIPFSFSASSGTDLMLKCVEEMPSLVQNSSSVDYMKVSINYGPSEAVSTQSWWKTSLDICSAINSKALEHGLPQQHAYDNSYTVILSIENSKNISIIEADYKDELFSQCSQAYDSQASGSVDYAEFSVNGSPVKEMTTQGWWKNSFDFCNALINKI